MITHPLGSIMPLANVTKRLLCMRFCKGTWRHTTKKTHVTAPSLVYVGPTLRGHADTCHSSHPDPGHRILPVTSLVLWKL